MSYLNLMGNKLKPKDVNDALEDINVDGMKSDITDMKSDITDIKSDVTTLTATVNAISFDTIASITAVENETLAEAIDRLRDNYFDDLTPFRQIKMDIDGTTNMIFTCVRWTGVNVSLWASSKPTSDTSMTTILIGMSSTTVSVRKFVTSASGVTGTSISTDIASGTIAIQGLKFS